MASVKLWSIDVAKWGPYRCSMRPDTGSSGQRHCLRIGATSFFFFFFISQIHPDSAPTKANSCRISLYRPKPPKQIDSACTGTEPTDSGRNSTKKKKCKKHHSNLSFKQQNPSPIHSSTFTLCFSSPLSHRHNQSLPKTQSHSLCHSLSIFGLFFAWLTVSTLKSQAHLTDPLSTQVSN